MSPVAGKKVSTALKELEKLEKVLPNGSRRISL
jgi:hypothetical protein